MQQRRPERRGSCGVSFRLVDAESIAAPYPAIRLSLLCNLFLCSCLFDFGRHFFLHGLCRTAVVGGNVLSARASSRLARRILVGTFLLNFFLFLNTLSSIDTGLHCLYSEEGGKSIV